MFSIETYLLNERRMTERNEQKIREDRLGKRQI
jgi:hypothetical protein